MQRNTVIGAVFISIVVLIALVLVVPNIIADWLWYQSLGRTDVFSRIITLQLGLFAAGLVVFGALYFGNMILVRKIVARAGVQYRRRLPLELSKTGPSRRRGSFPVLWV